MTEKRKISTRKIIQTLVTFVLLGCCVFATLSASKIQDNKKVKGVSIRIENEEVCKFVSKEEVEQTLFEKRHIEPDNIRIGNIDLKKMEHILATNPWIENAQVFVDNNRFLNIDVTQRIPQLRVFQKNGHSYYLDSSKHILPLSDRYTHYEVLFVNVPQIQDDSVGEVLKSRMLSIAEWIKRDSFWQAQTSQIIVNSTEDFELIPVLGTHKILLGDGSSLDKKLENLFAFYQDVLNKVGWDRYTILDARFSNQIVASPSLPWKAPVDRAITNMNWVKSIVGDAPKEENTAVMAMQGNILKIDSIKAR